MTRSFDARRSIISINPRNVTVFVSLSVLLSQCCNLLLNDHWLDHIFAVMMTTTRHIQTCFCIKMQYLPTNILNVFFCCMCVWIYSKIYRYANDLYCVLQDCFIRLTYINFCRRKFCCLVALETGIIHFWATLLSWLRFIYVSNFDFVRF